MWGDKSKIYMGGYQLFFSLGVLLGPLLAAPFVSKKHLDDLDDNYDLQYNNSTNRIAWPFIILGALLVLSVILSLVIYFYKPYIQPKSSSKFAKSNLDKQAKLDYICVTLFVIIVGSFVG